MCLEDRSVDQPRLLRSGDDCAIGCVKTPATHQRFVSPDVEPPILCRRDGASIGAPSSRCTFALRKRSALFEPHPVAIFVGATHQVALCAARAWCQTRLHAARLRWPPATAPLGASRTPAQWTVGSDSRSRAGVNLGCAGELSPRQAPRPAQERAKDVTATRRLRPAVAAEHRQRQGRCGRSRACDPR